jgi:magnesium chelatase family protein
VLAQTQSAAVVGIDAVPVQVEVDSGYGDTKVTVVGLPDAAVKESTHRVMSALSNSAFHAPLGRVVVNLAPADIRKEGPSFDLPIALGILAATEQTEPRKLDRVMVVGELALTGAVRPVKGALPIAMRAAAMGLEAVVVPAENAAEAAVVQGLDVIPVRNLREAALWLEGNTPIDPVRIDVESLFKAPPSEDLDLSDVRGQESAKRALEVAAAGGHNLLLIGVPGTGKSMLAKRLATILPPLHLAEALETTQVHSICGLLAPGQALVTQRPFRSPHHTASDAGLLGGNAHPTPGEISLAHHGVLFLDELPEFKRSVLETLRQPLEEGRVTISRAAGSMTFPAQFTLVAAMNPTPDGKMPHESRSSPREIASYLGRVSGPLLDRIDLHVEVPAVRFADLSRAQPGEPSAVVRQRVLAARQIQRARFAGRPVNCNARMRPRDLREFVRLDESTRDMLRVAMTDLNLSARAHDRILKVARTLADLAARPDVSACDISEAIGFRNLDRQLWG